MSWAEINEQRQREMREHEEESKAFVRRVTEQLHEQQSAFQKEFDETDKRISILIQQDKTR
jgi:hypothetical protein